jgi:hypothetical protein
MQSKVLAMARIPYSKRTKSNTSKGKNSGGAKSTGHQGQASKSPLPVESHVCPRSSSTRSQRVTCLLSGKMVRSSVLQALLGIRHVGTSCLNLPKFQSPSRTALVPHKPHCLYTHCRHIEQSSLTVLKMGRGPPQI